MKLNELKSEEQSAVSGGSILSGLPLIGDSDNDSGAHSSGHDGDHHSNEHDSQLSGLPIVGNLLGDAIL